MTEDHRRHLHFAVRSEQYEQHLGYGYFMDYVLRSLNAERPSAENILYRTAELMLNAVDVTNLSTSPEKQERDLDVFENCLPENLKHLFETHSLRALFGSAANPQFGLPCPRMIQLRDTYGIPNWETDLPKVFGTALISSILSGSHTILRDYFTPLERDYGLDRFAIPRNYKIEFSYPIPDSTVALPLMQIGTPQALQEDLRGRYTGDASAIESHIVAPFAGRYKVTGDGIEVAIKERNVEKLIYLHPHCTEEYFQKLLQCVVPLHETALSDSASFEQRKTTMTEAYWLLAQSTPVWRCGSAYARVIMEHLADRIREQHPDFTIPYTKMETDLWAEATATPLHKFKQRFLKGFYFDHKATDKSVETYFDAFNLRGLRTISLEQKTTNSIELP